LTVRQSTQQVRKVKTKKTVVLSSRDPDLEDKIDQLRQALGTKVSINKEGGKGQIIIDFYSEQELNELINKLS
jgi:uncharacterized protein with von Willebrand factor type A (vWA) domain